ncbi:hypothetical protein [Dinoroseobacter sp. S124A]|uniref:hypothetical protein n=1 Tax=Dinoroseobacter sp. S124A TaxID=3415128 RepID=UPI003C7B783B
MLETGLQRIRSTAHAIAIPTRFDAARGFARLSRAAVGMTLLTLGMLMLDDRMIGGEPVWLKPFKFSVSFALLFATLGLATQRLSPRWRTSWLLVSTVGASGAAFVFEMAYIGTQAARQELSHFNDTTPFHAMMYGLMGAGATVLMLTVGLVGGAVWMDRAARFAPRLRLGIALGFIATMVLTFWVAGTLAGNGGRFVGLPSADGPKLPLLGWSMEVGDLRPAHFFALHAMQILPVFGLLADRLNLSARVIWIVALLYASFTAMVFLKALQGIPLISA